MGQGNLALHVPDDRDAVLLRRHGLEQDLGLGGSRFTYMDQVHSADVVSVDGPADVSDVPTCDALVSPNAGQPLAVMVADCVPVVFAGTTASGTISAVAHAGRRGLLDGILANTVEHMKLHGATGLEAWIGPSICGSCYEVPASMAEESEALRPGITTATRWGTTGLDLPGEARRELEHLGVSVTPSGICTLENEDYFSYRRDPGTGRLAGLVWSVE
ncbi:polyphenol oxidase family protein [Paeniglutamicibacter sp. R2-26]|uniref:polyphenol oxidase family protein n=1 Tax=Paeniglutamicibacter sp. R2-26 TaxID=3144417 RepID=UPI003EE7A446